MNRPSNINPQPPKESALQLFFNRLPWLGGRNMLPDSRGTFDASLEWPLTPNLELLESAEIVVGTQIDLVPRLAGMHTMVTRLLVSPATVPVAGDVVTVTLAPPNTGSLFSVVCDCRLFPMRTAGYPLIGGISIADVPAGGVMHGSRPVYVPEKWNLRLAYNGNVASQIQLRIEFFQLASTQPLTSLWNY